ncbi:MAG: hypothetical protein BWZ02_02356 [Lentisphaerae bacterium ADurb.BinA184]|nr:MAG: hypothetical protein BWZ02_02356 [Lentisphaerae bacterium ADurb.BinA184]
MYGNSDAAGLPKAHMIADMPPHERPRERLAVKGSDALKDEELIAILLRTGRAGRSALLLAQDLLARFEGRLDRVAAAGLAEIRGTPGIGPAKAVELYAAFSLARRLAAQPGDERVRLDSPATVAARLQERFRGLMQEEFHVLLLDTKNHLLRDECATVGLVDRSQVHAREVFRAAIRECCSRVLLAHNHPTGDPTPSPQDLACTRNLVAAGKVIGIEVLDHVIVGQPGPACPRGFVSLREENLL